MPSLHRLMERIGLSHEDEHSSVPPVDNQHQGQTYGYLTQPTYANPPQDGYAPGPPQHNYSTPNGTPQAYSPYGAPHDALYGGSVASGPNLSPTPFYTGSGATVSGLEKQSSPAPSHQNFPPPPMPPNSNAYPGYYTGPTGNQDPHFSSNNPYGQLAQGAPTSPAAPLSKKDQALNFLKTDKAKYGAGGLVAGAAAGAAVTGFIAHQKHKKERKEFRTQKEEWESQKQDFLLERQKMQAEIQSLKAQRQSHGSYSSSSHYYGVSGRISGGSSPGMGMGGGHNSSLDARIAALEMENRRNEMYMVQQARMNNMDMMMFQQEMMFNQDILMMDNMMLEQELMMDADRPDFYGGNGPEYVDNSTTIINNTTVIDENNDSSDNESESSDDDNRDNFQQNYASQQDDEDNYSNSDDGVVQFQQDDDYERDSDQGNDDQGWFNDGGSGFDNSGDMDFGGCDDF